MKLIKYKKFKFIFIAILCIFTAIAMITFSTEITAAIIKSINNCLTIIIPSLYGLMILSNFMIKSNIYALLGKPFSLFSRYIFKLPYEYFSVFIISNFAGYPVGAVMIKELLTLDRIDKKTAEDMLSYCYAPSPTFIIGLIGISVFNERKIGLLIYLVCVLTNFCIAFLKGIQKEVPEVKLNDNKITVNGQMIIESIEISAKTLFKICIMIVFFSIAISLIESLGIFNVIEKYMSLSKFPISQLFKSSMEISNIADFPQNCYSQIGMLSSISSFGGICIMLQVISITGKKLNIKKFLQTRAICTVISYLISKIVFSLIPLNILTFSQNVTIRITENNSLAPSVFLIIMTIILLLKKRSGKISKSML